MLGLQAWPLHTWLHLILSHRTNSHFPYPFIWRRPRLSVLWIVHQRPWLCTYFCAILTYVPLHRRLGVALLGPVVALFSVWEPSRLTPMLSVPFYIATWFLPCSFPLPPFWCLAPLRRGHGNALFLPLLRFAIGSDISPACGVHGHLKRVCVLSCCAMGCSRSPCGWWRHWIFLLIFERFYWLPKGPHILHLPSKSRIDLSLLWCPPPPPLVRCTTHPILKTLWIYCFVSQSPEISFAAVSLIFFSWK